MSPLKSKTPAALADTLSRETGTVVRQALQLRAEVEPFARIWQQLVSAAVALHSRPVLYKNRQLTVWCDSPVWATTLRHSGPTIKARIDRSGLPKVLELRIRVEPPDSPLTPNRPLTERKRPTEASLRLLESMVRSIHDPGLRASLEKLRQALERSGAA